VDEDRHLAILRESELCNRTPVMWGSNGVWTVDLVMRGKPAGRAIYKPRSGEAPLWDFPDGTLYKRERAAYLAACALGWTFIPATIVRDGPLGVGMVQRYIDHEERRGVPRFDRSHIPQLAIIALFDYLTNNADRKSAHCLVDGDGRVWGIDHGLTFHRDPKQRTVLAEFFGTPVEPAVLKALRRWRGDAGAVDRLRKQLCELLHPGEVEDFFKRLDKVIGGGKIPEGRSRGYWYW
jgi:hypothetical protein